MPKVYFKDAGMMNCALNRFYDFQTREDQGQLVENYVYKRLTNLYDKELYYLPTFTVLNIFIEYINERIYQLTIVTLFGNYLLSLPRMRIIKEKTLPEFCKLSKYKQAEESLKAWTYEVKYSIWNNANELKSKYGNASIVSSKRVVFNIKGNDFRLIVDIEYKLKIVFIVWFGTHPEYDKIDAKIVAYEN